MRMLTSFATCLIFVGLSGQAAFGQDDNPNDPLRESEAYEADNATEAPLEPPQDSNETTISGREDARQETPDQAAPDRQVQQERSNADRQVRQQDQDAARPDMSDETTGDDRNRDRREGDSSQSGDNDDDADSHNRRQENRERLDRVQSAADLNVEFSTVNNGLQLTQINQTSVLRNSGLRRGDVLVSVQGRSLRNEGDFLRWYRGLPSGARVPLIVFRDGRRQTIYLTNTWGYDRGYDQGYGRDYDQDYDARPGYGGAYLGVVFDDRYPNLAIVEVVRRNTAADQAGLRPGDTIQSINGQRVRGQNHATQLIASMQPGEEIDLVYARRERTSARLGSRSEGAQVSYDEYDGNSDYNNGRSDEVEQVESYERRYTGSDGAIDGRFEQYNRPGMGDNGPVRRAITRPLRND